MQVHRTGRVSVHTTWDLTWELGINFVKRKMAPDNEPKKVTKATQLNDARIYKLEYVGNFGRKGGKIF